MAVEPLTNPILAPETALGFQPFLVPGAPSRGFAVLTSTVAGNAVSLYSADFARLSAPLPVHGNLFAVGRFEPTSSTDEVLALPDSAALGSIKLYNASSPVSPVMLQGPPGATEISGLVRTAKQSKTNFALNEDGLLVYSQTAELVWIYNAIRLAPGAVVVPDAVIALPGASAHGRMILQPASPDGTAKASIFGLYGSDSATTPDTCSLVLFWLQNDGSGTAFLPYAALVSASALPGTMAKAMLFVQDIDGLQGPELVVVTSGSRGAIVFFALLDVGLYSSRPAVIVPTLNEVAAVVWTDINGDTLEDLFVASDFEGVIGYVNLGFGAFSGPNVVQSPSASNYAGLLSGDYGGPRPYVYALNTADPAVLTSLKPLPGGTYTGAYDLAMPKLSRQYSQYPVLGDFNSDAALDVLLTINVAPNSFSVGTLMLMLGDGSGSFGTGTSIASGVGAYAAARLNADSILDILYTSPRSQFTLAYQLGKGDGTFGQAMNAQPSGTSVSYSGNGPMPIVLAADITGDLWDDFIVYDRAGSRIVQLNNPGHAALASETVLFNVNPVQRVSIAFIDVNGDKQKDLVVAGRSSSMLYALLYNNATQLFEVVGSPNLAVVDAPAFILVTRVNADSFDDLVVLRSFGSTLVYFRGSAIGLEMSSPVVVFDGSAVTSTSAFLSATSVTPFIANPGSTGYRTSALDLIVHYVEGMYVFVNNGAGGFPPLPVVLKDDISDGGSLFADVTGDSFSDVLFFGVDPTSTPVGALLGVIPLQPTLALQPVPVGASYVDSAAGAGLGLYNYNRLAALDDVIARGSHCFGTTVQLHGTVVACHTAERSYAIVGKNVLLIGMNASNEDSGVTIDCSSAMPGAWTAGGSIYNLAAGATLALSNVNVAATGAMNSAFSLATGSRLIARSGVFAGGMAKYGSGFLSAANSAVAVQLYDSVLSDYIASADDGGAIGVRAALDGSLVVLARTNCTRNKALAGHGGALALSGMLNAWLLRAVFTQNSAAQSGGGVRFAPSLNQADFRLNWWGGAATDNTASAAGGALALVLAEGFNFRSRIASLKNLAFDRSSAVWGGTLAVVRADSDLTASCLNSLAFVPPAKDALGTLMAVSAYDNIGTDNLSFGLSSATYGGWIYACGGGLLFGQITTNVRLNGPFTAKAGGAFAFYCGLASEPSSAGAQPYPNMPKWVVFQGMNSIGVLVTQPDPCTHVAGLQCSAAYGPSYAATAAEIAVGFATDGTAAAPALGAGGGRSVPSGLDLLSALGQAKVAMYDRLGNVFVDARVQLEPRLAGPQASRYTLLTNERLGVMPVLNPAAFPAVGLIAARAAPAAPAVLLNQTIALHTMRIAANDPAEALAPAAAVIVALVIPNAPPATPVVANLTLSIVACPPGMGLVSGPGDPVVCAPCAYGVTFSNETSVAACRPIPDCRPDRVFVNGACVGCPANTLRTVDATAPYGVGPCLCRVGFYEPSATPDLPCLACPFGGYCAGELAQPVAAPGFFPSNTANTFVACPNPRACAGNGQCARTYRGRVCSECIAGYSRLNARCYACNTARTVLVSLVLVALVLGACAGILYFNCKKEISYKFAALMIGLNSLQISATYGRIELSWPGFAEAWFPIISALNLNPELVAPECWVAGSVDVWALQWALMIALPAISALAFCLVAAVFLLAIKTVLKSRTDLTPAALGDAAVRGWYQALVLLYMPVVAATLSFFACKREPGGRWALESQPARTCYTAGWWRLFPVALVFTLAYCAGIPAFILAVLRARRKALSAVEFELRMGFLVARFTDSAFYYECFVMARKLGVVLAVTAFSGQASKAHAAVLLLACAWVHLVSLTPYRKRLHSRLDVLVLGSCVAVLYGGTLEDRLMRQIVVLGAIVLNCLAIGVGVALDLWLMRRAERDAETDEFFMGGLAKNADDETAHAPLAAASHFGDRGAVRHGTFVAPSAGEAGLELATMRTASIHESVHDARPDDAHALVPLPPPMLFSNEAPLSHSGAAAADSFAGGSYLRTGELVPIPLPPPAPDVPRPPPTPTERALLMTPPPPMPAGEAGLLLPQPPSTPAGEAGLLLPQPPSTPAGEAGLLLPLPPPSL